MKTLHIRRCVIARRTDFFKGSIYTFNFEISKQFCCKVICNKLKKCEYQDAISDNDKVSCRYLSTCLLRLNNQIILSCLLHVLIFQLKIFTVEQGITHIHNNCLKRARAKNRKSCGFQTDFRFQ